MAFAGNRAGARSTPFAQKGEEEAKLRQKLADGGVVEASASAGREKADAAGPDVPRFLLNGASINGRRTGTRNIRGAMAQHVHDLRSHPALLETNRSPPSTRHVQDALAPIWQKAGIWQAATGRVEVQF